MSAPVIQSLIPALGAIDVVLGQPVIVQFDQPVDPSTVSSKTFILMGPGQTVVVDAEELIRTSTKVQTGREYITGSFAFPAPSGTDAWLQNQKIVFTPGHSLRPNVIYTVLMVGRGSSLATSFIQNSDAEPLVKSVQYTFTTGALDQSVSPVQSPILPVDSWLRSALSPNDVIVRPRRVVGNDLTQTIDLIFPAPIDTTSFDPNDIIVAGEPFLNDPDTLIPDGSNSVVVIDGNKLSITVTWGPEPGTGVDLLSLYSDPGDSGPAPDDSDFGTNEPENNPFVRPD